MPGPRGARPLQPDRVEAADTVLRRNLGRKVAPASLSRLRWAALLHVVGWLAVALSYPASHAQRQHEARGVVIFILSFVLVAGTGVLSLRWRWMVWFVAATRIVTAASSVIAPLLLHRRLVFALLGTALLAGSCYLTLADLMVDRRRGRKVRVARLARGSAAEEPGCSAKN